MKRKNENQIESPIFMYILAFVMFILLSVTSLKCLNEILGENNEEKLDIKDKIEKNENFEIKTNTKIVVNPYAKNLHQKKVKQNYSDLYKNYQKEIEYRQRLLALQRENEELILKQQKREEQIARERQRHNAQMQAQTRTEPIRELPQPIKAERIQPDNKSHLLTNAMKQSPCNKTTATAIVYFFHPNNSEPVEIIFNSPNYNNQGQAKMIFGDLPRSKQHILKSNYQNLSDIINRPQYSTSQKAPQRDDIIMKISAGVTTNCTPYVYKSNDFYVTNIPVAQTTFNQRENYCKSKNARLADSLELISLVLTGRFPQGYYWTTSHAYKIDSNATYVSRNVLSSTPDYLLLDYGNSSIGFLPQSEIGSNLNAFSVCVVDN